MPIHVTIAINDREVEHLHIARMSGAGRNPDAVHTYSALRQHDAPKSEKEWDAGVLFTHRYGDDITVCVQHALEALQTVPHEPAPVLKPSVHDLYPYARYDD